MTNNITLAQAEQLIEKLTDKTLSFKYIKLKNGIFCKVSKQHYDELSKYNWNTNIGGYVVIGSQSMCDKILEIENLPKPDGWEVDHINGDILDNRIENLRCVTTSQNHMNQKKTRGKSIYKGVSKKGENEKRQQDWLANIKVDGKVYNLGRFYSEEIAAREYDRIASFLYGEYARLNFPKERHPITLSRLLFMAQEQLNYTLSQCKILVNMWDFSKEHLQDQSAETINFYHIIFIRDER